MDVDYARRVLTWLDRVPPIAVTIEIHRNRVYDLAKMLNRYAGPECGQRLIGSAETALGATQSYTPSWWATNYCDRVSREKVWLAVRAEAKAIIRELCPAAFEATAGI